MSRRPTPPPEGANGRAGLRTTRRILAALSAARVTRHAARRLSVGRGLLLESLGVVTALTALAVYLTWPVALNFNGSIFGLGGDSTGTIAWLRSLAEAGGFHITGTREVDNVGAPFGVEYANGVNVQWAFVFFPAYVTTELTSAVVAYNIAIFSGLVLSGACMYWLVRRLGGGWPAASWAALVFTVFPWHLEKAQRHATLVHLEGFPLLVLAILAWYARPDLVRAVVIAGATAVLWTTAGYFGVMALVALAVLLPLAALVHRRQFGLGRALGRLAFAMAAVLVVVGVVYAIASLGATKGEIASQRNVGELNTYGARPWEFVLPSYRNPLFGDDVSGFLSRHLHGSNFSETSLYVGWVTILLAAAWLVWALTKRRVLRSDVAFATVALTVLAATALAFSLPSPLPRTDLPTPVTLVWEVVPQFRVPSRFIALVMTGLIPLAALALNEIVRSVFAHTWRPAMKLTATGVIVVVTGLASFLELSASDFTTVTRLDRAPPEYEAVRAAPPGLLAEYPLASADHGITSDYLFWQDVHDRPLVNGARVGTFADGMRESLVDPASPGTAEALAMLGVSVIVVRPNVYAFTGGPPTPPTLGRGYKLLARTSRGVSVWEVVARPAPAIAVFEAGFGPTETPPGQPASRWLMQREGWIAFYSERSGSYSARFVATSYARPRALQIADGLSSVTRTVETTRLKLPVAVPRGRSRVSVTTDPGPEPIPDGRTVSVYVSNWSFVPLPPGHQGARIAATPTSAAGDPGDSRAEGQRR